MINISKSILALTIIFFVLIFGCTETEVKDNKKEGAYVDEYPNNPPPVFTSN